MLDSILVPLDRSKISEQILPYVEALAKGLAVPVKLIHVVDTKNLPESLEPRLQGHLDLLAQKERDRAAKYLENMRYQMEGDDGVVVSAEVMIGSPDEEIASFAYTQGMGMIAMSTHGRSGPERWYMGSVADKVLESALVPLLLYRPKEDEVSAVKFEKLIIPLDGSTVAEQALPTAEALAKKLDLELLIVRVLNTYSWVFADMSPYGAHSLPSELLKTLEEAATGYLDKKATDLQQKGFKVGSRLMLGNPGSEINELASETPNSLVVISTHGRSGVNRMVMGSVADKVVRGSGSPVLLLMSAE